MSEASRPPQPPQRPRRVVNLSDAEHDSSFFESVDMKKSDEYSHLEALVKTVFSNELGFDVTRYVREEDGNPAFEIRNGSRETPCLDISFKKDLSQVDIHQLNKCDDFRTGSFLLINVEELLKKIPQCQAIELYDESHIYRCGNVFDLAQLEILKTGQSWYNKRGYKQENYDEETEWNKQQIDIPVSEALKIVARQTLDSDFSSFSQYKAKLDATIPQLIQVQDINSLKLNEYIKILFDYIKSFPDHEVQCSHEQNNMARKVAHVIKSFIKTRRLNYNKANNNLRKVLSSSAHGGSKKKTMRKSHRRIKIRPRKTKTRPRKTKTRPRKTKTRPRKTKTRAKFRF
jgi:hypothetical protein